MKQEDILQNLMDILTNLEGKKAEITITCKNGDYDKFVVVKSLKKSPNKGYFNSKNRRK